MLCSSSSTFASQTKLSGIRAKLESSLNSKQTFKFCADDCSIVPEDISLEAYTQLLHSPGPRKDAMHRVFIAATNEPTPTQASVLSGSSFVLKFIQMGDNPSDALNTGSLHATAFKGQNPSAMILSELRRLMGKM